MTLADILDAARGVNRGVVGLLGAPVDLANTALANVGGDKPVMGSEWLLDKLQQAGLMSPPPTTAVGQALEPTAGLATPAEWLKLAKIAGAAAVPAGRARLVQSGEKVGKVRGTSGLFPESGGVSPQKETALLKNFVADAKAGEPYSRFWYDDASKDLYRLTGKDVPDADKLAGLMATTSSGTPVNANTMYGFKAWNQALTGAPIESGKYPTAMGKVMSDVMSGAEGTTGLKRTPYQQGLSIEWRPPEGDLRPVNDIHQASALTGQEIRRGLKAPEHAWLDTMNERALAKLREDDPTWTSYQTQAAAWAPQRVKAGLAPDLASASKHYGDFIPDYSAQITREWTPGATTGHLPELLAGTPQATSLQDILARALEQHTTTAQGTDAVAHALGALSERTLPNAGLYKGAAAPGYASQLPVGKKAGEDVIDPASAKVADAVAAMYGMLSPQDQVAWNFLSGKAPIKSAGGYRISTGAPMSVDELRALQSELGEAGQNVQVDPRGARGLIFDDPGTPERTTLAQIVRDAAAKRGGDVTFHERSSNLLPFDAPDKWTVKPFLEAAEAAGPKVAQNIAERVPPIAKGVLDTTEQLAQQHGLTTAPWYRPLMEGLARGGLPEVRRLYEAGIVPVAALAALGLHEATAGAEDTAAQ